MMTFRGYQATQVRSDEPTLTQVIAVVDELLGNAGGELVVNFSQTLDGWKHALSQSTTLVFTLKRHTKQTAKNTELTPFIYSVRVFLFTCAWKSLTCHYHAGLRFLLGCGDNNHHIVRVLQPSFHQPAEGLLNTLSERADLVPKHHNTLPRGRRSQLGEPRQLAGGEGLLALWRGGREILGKPRLT